MDNLKGQGAVKYLIENKSGEIERAFYRKDLGDIGIFWDKDGVGLAHFVHREKAVENLTDVIENGTLQKSKDNSVKIYKKSKGSGGTAVVKLDYKGTPKKWVITAYSILPIINASTHED